MATRRIGILHPGEMGSSVAASARNSDCEVYWASEGRTAATRERAVKAGLQEVKTVAELCRRCSIIVSVCPPHVAEALANEVLHAGFRGWYVEANAIAPQRSIKIGEMMRKADVSFVDGGITGPPAWKPDTTCLYLSGPRAEEAAAYFSAGPLDTKVLGPEIGKASALKMCYAADRKGTIALFAAILMTAEKLGVRDTLVELWKQNDPEFPEQVEKRIQASAPKAWRFVGEMEEISQTFSDAGAPGEFYAAAANVYARLERFKDSRTPPALDDILAALLR